MRFPLTYCIVIFFFGWLLGCIFVIIYLDQYNSTPSLSTINDSNYLHPYSSDKKIHRTIFIARKFLHNIENKLANLKIYSNDSPMNSSLSAFTDDAISDTSTENVMLNKQWIYLDWPVDEKLFTIHNYYALESLLTQFSKGIFRILLPSSDCFKLPGILSAYQFIKYKKLKYNIEVIPIMDKLHIQQRIPASLSNIGQKYLEKWLRKCKTSHGIPEPCYNGGQHKFAPYHLLNFIRLVKLWHHGGIFTDFSFLFLGKLTPPYVHQGFYMNSYCGSKEDMEHWQILEQRKTMYPETSIETGLDEERTPTQSSSGTAYPVFLHPNESYLLSPPPLNVTNELVDTGNTSHLHDIFTKPFRSFASSSPLHRATSRRFDNNCVTSTLLAFHTPHSEIIRCILKYYDNLSFLSCIEADTIYTGADCVGAAFERCFDEYSAKNDLLTSNMDRNDNVQQDKSLVTEPSSSALLLSVTSSLTSIPSPEPSTSKEKLFGSNNLLLFFSRSKNKYPKSSGKGINPETTLHNKDDTIGSNHMVTIIEVFNHNPTLAKSILLSCNINITSNPLAIWLGTLAWTGHWDKIGSCKDETLLGLLVKQSIKLNKLEIQHRTYGLIKPVFTGHLSVGNKTSYNLRGNRTMDVIDHPMGEDFVQHYSSLVSSRCHRYPTTDFKLVNPFAIQSKYRNILVNANVDQQDEISESSRGYFTGMQSVACTPSLVIAGFATSSVRYLMSMILEHPRILPPLSPSSSSVDWTGCFSKVNILRDFRQGYLNTRMWCYPLIMETDPFLSMDVSTRYALDATVPYTLQQDNAISKVIFILRHPVDRMQAEYAEYIEKRKWDSSSEDDPSFPSFDALALLGMAKGSKYANLREMIRNDSHIKHILNYFYTSKFTVEDTAPAFNMTGVALNQLIQSLFENSLYALPILHYLQVLGEMNVLIISSDDLHQLPVNTTINHVYRFIDIEELSISSSEVKYLDHPNEVSVPDAHQISQDIYQKLQHFFNPFNELLSETDFKNITPWTRSNPPSQYSLYSCLNISEYSAELKLNIFGVDNIQSIGNQSLPMMWFQLEEKDRNQLFHGKIVDHLIPHRTSDVENGFNTTLGMLAVFRK